MPRTYVEQELFAKHEREAMRELRCPRCGDAVAIVSRRLVSARAWCSTCRRWVQGERASARRPVCGTCGAVVLLHDAKSKRAWCTRCNGMRGVRHGESA